MDMDVLNQVLVDMGHQPLTTTDIIKISEEE